MRYMKRKEIPFFKNTPSDTHCLQAALKMLLAYYFPDRRFSWRQLDEITGHKDGQWSFPYKMYVWLAAQGVQVEHVERFPIRRFAREGVGFLKAYWSPENFKQQKRYADFSAGQRDARAAIKDPRVTFRYRNGTVEVLRTYWTAGYTAIVRVNPFTLRGEEGLGSHVVVVTAVHTHTITVHDPGLPPRASLTVDIETFKRAMFDNKSLIIALKK